ncbi:MAG: TIR domain-containing protein [Phycisphaerales bacterium]|nr:MAG: TIR domain-containing protein [Phycisphaerales bacterium]
MGKYKFDDPKEAFAEAEKRIQKALETGSPHLNLRRLGLTEVPESLAKLVQLQWLGLDRNRLAQLPEWLGQLSWLQLLRLTENQLTAAPESLGQLIRLRTLHLHRNQLTSVPKWLRQLAQLETLSLSDNQLTVLPKWLCQLTKLRLLLLSGNHLTALPKSLRTLPELEAVYLHGNDALGLPAEVLGPTWEDVIRRNAKAAKASDILDYYFRTRGGKRPLNEAKLILLGRGEVGKTCLVNRLVHDKYVSTSMTKGINITAWPVKLRNDTVRLHVWDFGGQEIQHATHQFFLTERSLYLVMLNGRAGAEDEDAEYWLKFVKTFGAGSPTIVVLNKCKVNPFVVNRRALQEKYPFICAFVETDCKPQRGNGMPQLKREIAAALADMEHVRTAFPADWFAIKDKLAEMKKPFISFKEYRKFCAGLGEKDTEAQERLAGFLNALGIALNYRTDPRLRDETVLNPHWITKGVYQIITNKGLRERQGELRLSDLADILPKRAYPARMHGFLIELMRKFELCFPYHDDPKEHRYLVPELLGKEQPALKDAFAPDECLNFRYEYKLMPEGLLPRFITRTHTMSRPAERWLTGVVLRWEGCRALVKADKDDRQVLVRVHGSPERRRRLLAVIRENFDHIHSEMREFKPQEWVALQKHPEGWMGHAELEVLEKQGEREVRKVVGQEVVPVDVTELLDETDVPGARQRREFGGERERQLKLFISYAHEDEKWRAKLAPNLGLLEREGLVEVWCDLQIAPGDKWDDEIKRKLEEADLYLFLLSTDLLNSDYVQEVELPIARGRHEQGQARLIPVVVRKCSWKGYVGDIQALPAKAKPVKQWRDKDDACFDVEEGLRKTIAELRAMLD